MRYLQKSISTNGRRHLKEILSFYSENILFRSPKVNLVYPDRTSVIITNKTELEEYFSLGLKKYPNLYFVPVDYFFKNHKVIYEYHGMPDNKVQCSVIEKFEFNREGLISNSEVYYGVEEQYGT